MIALRGLAGMLGALDAVAASHAALAPSFLAAAADLAEQNLTTGGRYSPGTPVATGYARAQWRRVRAKDGVALVNAAPYIGALEDGHSRQAARGIRAPIETHARDLMADALRATGRARLAAGLG